MEYLTTVLHVLLFVHHIVGPPVQQGSNKSDDKAHNGTAMLDEMGIEYTRYLTQVVEALESDPEFRKKLETAEEADVRSGKIAQELDFVNHNVRTKLDELKREELNRLRHLARQAYEAENEVDVNPKHLKEPKHIDHANPHSFEIADLHKLITQVTEDLAEADKLRHKEFKEYEMQKEFEKQEKLKQLDEEHRKEYLHNLEDQKKRHDQHDPIHHPGSKQQLKEVWEKQDEMVQQDFNPKTFFYMHDIDGNGVWDQDEVKALFVKELDKMYEAGAPEDDMRERVEDMERMREHVFGEMDVNKDGLISLEEFLNQTKNPEFEKDPGWETVDHQQVYTPEEYAEFERRRQEEIERLIAEGKLQRLPPPPRGIQPPPPPPGGQQYQNQYPQQNYQYQEHPQQYQQPQGGYQQYQQPQGGYQQYPQQQQPMANNIPQQQQPVVNNIPQQQPMANNIPQQQPVANNIHQQQPMANNIPQQPQQPVANNIPQKPVANNIHQQPQQPMSNNIPQQPQQPMANNIPQQQQPVA